MACTGIRGGGYGAILRYRGHEKTFSEEGYMLTTNNRIMELMAAIVALEALKNIAK